MVYFPGQWGTAEVLSLLGIEPYVISISGAPLSASEIKYTSLPLPVTVEIMNGLSTAGPALTIDYRSYMQLFITGPSVNR
jgi:hypothetical protein